MFYTFFPYKRWYKETTYAQIVEWGRTEQIHLADMDYNRTDLFKKFKNLNGFPLRINIFPRYPTAVKVDEFPTPFVNSYLMNDVWRAVGYGGVDGFLLATAAKMLNFTAVNVPQIGIDYGFQSGNGTFVGKAHQM